MHCSGGMRSCTCCCCGGGAGGTRTPPPAHTHTHTRARARAHAAVRGGRPAAAANDTAAPNSPTHHVVQRVVPDAQQPAGAQRRGRVGQHGAHARRHDRRQREHDERSIRSARRQALRQLRARAVRHKGVHARRCVQPQLPRRAQQLLQARRAHVAHRNARRRLRT
jgi:hypothetical protein